MNTILVIEDEIDLAEILAFHLEKEGYRPLLAHDGISGWKKACSEVPDLVLLDLLLPGMSGIEVCKAIKGNEKTAAIPVVMLSARGDEIDRVVGLEIGADDYVVKPFSTRELMLRIKAVLRRGCRVERAGNFCVGPVCIDTDRHTVTIGDVEILLTTIEYKLLLSLAERAGKVQSRERLLSEVWGVPHGGDTRTVDTHITRLRAKMGRAADLVKTVRGFGYKMEDH